MTPAPVLNSPPKRDLTLYHELTRVSVDTTKILIEMERLRLKKDLIELIQANHERGGSVEGFLFHGRRYSKYPLKTLRGVTLKPLVEELEVPMQLYLDGLDELHIDMKRMRMLLAKIAGYCTEPQQFRDLLPDVVVQQLWSGDVKREQRIDEVLVDLNIPGNINQEIHDLMLKYQGQALVS